MFHSRSSASGWPLLQSCAVSYVPSRLGATSASTAPAAAGPARSHVLHAAKYTRLNISSAVPVAVILSALCTSTSGARSGPLATAGTT